MIFEETPLAGAYVVRIERREDARGFFARTWDQREFTAHGLADLTVQESISFSAERGTLRGMHWQAAPYQETKFVRCTRGALYDVIIDLRPESPTFRQWFGIELTQDNHTALYVPKDFAHGFITLAEQTEALYLMSVEYQPGYDRGARYDDTAFGITWPAEVRVISDKDRGWHDYPA